MSAATPPPSGRRFPVALGILLALAAVSQALVLAQQLASDPLALTPVNDARVYWDWAGEIARGRLVGPTPYLSAPLYPYLVGLMRALGGGLATVYVAQALVHLATAAWLFRVAEKRFGPRAALVGTALYLALQEPAYHTGRILNCTLQLLVVVLLWDRMVAAHEAPRRGRLAGLGAALGLNVLANPTMLAAVPIVALWIAWIQGFGGTGIRAGATVLGVSLAVIAPAALHNWLAAREFIPVSAQGGVTFYHGNAPGADGVYHGIPGIAENRIQQNIDARTLLAGETDGSWNATSSAFFRKGLATWRADPFAALRLGGRKVWYFLTGRNYGDIYVPGLEREDGIASRLVLAPLPTAWLTIPALLALAWLLRDPRRHFPEALLVLAPFLTVATFWYSPRYRIPAVPLLAALCGYLIASIPVFAAEAGRRAMAVLAAAAVLVSIASGPLNAWIGFDSAVSLRGQLQHMLAGVLVEQNRIPEAERRYRAAIEAGYAPAQAGLADLFRRQGRREDAIAALREAVRAQPASAYAHRGLAVALAESKAYPEAEVEFRAALALDPNDWESMSGLANVLHATGQVDDAIALHRSAIERNPAYAGAHYNLGCVYFQLERAAEAEPEFLEALRIDPSLSQARWFLAEILTQRRDFAGARKVLLEGLQLAPGDSLLQQELQNVELRSR